MSIASSGFEAVLRRRERDVPAEAAAEWRSKEPWLLGLATFALSVIFGAILVFYYHVMQNDAFSRVMDAYYVIFHGFHLAAMGFVWNPLPSLMELPLVMLSSLWKPLITDAFAGNIVSALTAGVAAFYFTRILHQFGVSRAYRSLWLLIYVLNPMILLYEANGMSDCMMVAMMLASLEGALRFAKTLSIRALISSAVWLAITFLTRYEAVPFAFFLGLGILIGLLRTRTKVSKIAGVIIVLALPITYAGILWMLLNWVIMGNPFYFADSSYSNAAQMATGVYTTPITVMAHRHLFTALKVVTYFGELFPPVLPALALTVILAVRRKFDIQALVLIGATVAVPLLQLELLYKGSSAAWDRYFITYIPMGFVLIAYLYSLLPQAMKSWAGALAVLIFLVGDFQTWQALQTQGLGHGNRVLVQALQSGRLLSGTQTAQSRLVTLSTMAIAHHEANYINTHPKMIVLLDTFQNYGVVPWIQNHNQLVITNDTNFQSVLNNPRGRVTAILDPPSSGLGNLTAINVRYPTMYAGKVPWTRLIKTFQNGDHLYRVLGNAP